MDVGKIAVYEQVEMGKIAVYKQMKMGKIDQNHKKPSPVWCYKQWSMYLLSGNM